MVTTRRPSGLRKPILNISRGRNLLFALGSNGLIPAAGNDAGPVSESVTSMEVCPYCHRRLVSHASARCNWCGHVIDDPDYQAQAAANREAFIAEDILHNARMLAWQRNMPGMGPFGDPVFGNPSPNALVIDQDIANAAARRAAVRAAQMGPPAPDPQTTDDAQVDAAPATVDRYHGLELD